MSGETEGNEHGTVDKRLAAGSSEILVGFIGLSIIILGCISLFINIPKEYSLGATLCGLFFVLADTTLVRKKVGNKTLILHYFLLFLAVLSFFFLPVILLIFPFIKMKFFELNDFATMTTLGVVIILLANKALERREKQHQEIENNVKEIQRKQKELSERLEEKLKEFDEELKEVEDKNKNERITSPTCQPEDNI